MTPAEEQAAVDALRAPERRKCACRSSVQALSLDPPAITAAVVDHQQNDRRHRLWAAAGGMDQMLTREEREAVVPDMPPAELRRLRRTG